MKIKIIRALCGLTLGLLAAPLARAQSTAFTYQGRLVDDCCPATGYYDLMFRVYNSPDAVTSPNLQLGPVVAINRVPVTNGLFSVKLDFGAGPVSTNLGRWLQIDARTNNPALPMVSLSPRTELTPTPRSIFAYTAGSAGVANVANVANSVAGGAITATTLAPSPAAHQVLSYNGSGLQWVNAGGSGTFSLPYSGAVNSSDSAWMISNSGPGAGIHGITTGGSSASWQFGGVLGEVPASLASYEAVGVRGWNHSTGPYGHGIYGTHEGSGDGVFGICYREGRGVYGQANAAGGIGVYGLNVSAGTYAKLGTATHGLEVGGHALVNGNMHLYGSSTLYFEGGPADPYYYLATYPTPDAAGMRLQGYSGVKLSTGFGNDVVNVIGNNVGIGTPAPSAPLHIQGSQAYERMVSTSTLNGSVLELWNTTPESIDGPPVTLGAINFGDGSTTPGQISYQSRYGMGFRVGGTELMRIDLSGNTTVGSLTIRGGADLAEPFQMSEEQIAAGSVVVIDEENPGRLKQATRAYDTRVAGIISGANGVKAGIALHQEGVLEGGQNVALTGQVYVKANASFGAIKPGDLLTTSDTPGHAMKVVDPSQAQGAILGKAMTALKEGTGMVLVLVSLQ